MILSNLIKKEIIYNYNPLLTISWVLIKRILSVFIHSINQTLKNQFQKRSNKMLSKIFMIQIMINIKINYHRVN